MQLSDEQIQDTELVGAPPVGERNKGQFKPGQSGNPAGRPPGSGTIQSKVRAATKENIDEIMKKLVEMAKAGDVSAMNLLMSRTVAPIKSESFVETPIEIPEGATPVQKLEIIQKAAATGQIGLETAKSLSDLVNTEIQANMVSDIEERLALLEAKRLSR